MNSKITTVTSDSEDDVKDSLVDLFKGLRKDMADHKAETARLNEETARLNRSLRQEQKERKADSASHKEETAQLKEEAARLNRSLRQEQQERKVDSASHKEEAARQDTKLGELERELRNAKKQHNSDIRDISEVCTITVLCFFFSSTCPHLFFFPILAHSKVGPHPSPDSIGPRP